MGADNVSEEHTIGVTQHALLSSDYLLYPSQYMCEKMLNAYKINDIYSGKVLMEGYPRNDVFFDENQRNKVKSELNLNDKEVLVYMPTYKGSYHDLQNKKQITDLKRFFKKLDTQLNDNQVLLVKLHHFNDNDFDLNNYNHIVDFPSDYETYDVLNTADVLITDYSSVLFDFACTGRKIILFNYDESEYMKYRGIYINLSDLPFPKVQNVDGLVREINSAKDYDDNEFINEYCTYNNAESTKRICRHIFNDEKVCVEKELKSDKRNILIYGGPLLIGRLDFLNNLISKIDLKKNNVFVSYPQWNSYIRNSHRDIFTRLPEEVKFVPFFSGISFTVREQIKYHKFLNSDYNPSLIHSMEKAFKREIDKLYYNFPYDAVINIDGIHSEQAILFSFCDCKTTVFVHNDMVREIKNKDKFNKNVYKYAYDHYDTVAVVSDDLIKPTSKLTSKTENIKVIHNLNDYDDIISKSNDEIEINDKTSMFLSNPNGIEGVLKGEGKKFISICESYSNDNNFKTLLSAFDEFCEDFPDTQLIIIFGHGNFNKIKREVVNLNHWENVSIFKWLLTPLPILKQCDLFIFSAKYTGWSNSIIHANTLNVPVIAYETVGTKWLKDYNGYLIKNSKAQMLKGFNDFMNGDIGLLDIDEESFDQESIKEFEKII